MIVKKSTSNCLKYGKDYLIKKDHRLSLFQMAKLIPKARRCLSEVSAQRIFLKLEQPNNAADHLR